MNSRVIALIIIVLVAIISALGTGIVMAKLGASSLATVGAGGAAFIAVATLGTAFAALLLPPAQAPPASS
ncbi:hypothetical protein ACFU3J_16220 [Streptomyces sp. NPDC057411]|uniref:hypothetical protein n=1 Tax=unclassified Streptomyces TaxID=2593676 RepID=UPI00362B2476